MLEGPRQSRTLLIIQPRLRVLPLTSPRGPRSFEADDPAPDNLERLIAETGGI